MVTVTLLGRITRKGIENWEEESIKEMGGGLCFSDAPQGPDGERGSGEGSVILSPSEQWVGWEPIKPTAPDEHQGAIPAVAMKVILPMQIKGQIGEMT